MSQPKRLSCDETVRRLDDYVDRELSPEEQRAVQAHLEVCTTCAREFTFESQVLQQIREKIDRIQLPDDLMGKILKRLDEPN